MKTILVDAVDGYISKDGEIFDEMEKLLQSYDNPKIVVTGANDEQFTQFGLDKIEYEVFTCKHDPEKTDPEYFRKLLATYNLNAGDVVYFEHNPAAVNSASSIGIESYFYDHNKKDLVSLKNFLDRELEEGRSRAIEMGTDIIS